MTATGKVVDSAGAPISYANVYLSDASGKPVSTEATISGDDGTFTLNDAKGGTHLTISLVGMAPTTVPVDTAKDTPGFQNTFTLEMPDSSISKEIVVTATRLPKPDTTPWGIIIAVTVVIAVSLGGLYWYLIKRKKK